MQHKKQQIINEIPGRAVFARGVGRLVALGLALLVAAGCMGPASVAWAQDEEAYKSIFMRVSVPFVSGYLGDPTDTTLTYVLEALDPANPLPPQVQNSQAVVVIKPGETGVFESLVFDRPGEYVYTLSQSPGGDVSATYDAAVFEVHVMVFYNNEGNPSPVMWFAQENVSGKFEQARFENIYTTSGGTPDSPANPDGPGGKDVFELPTPFGSLPLTGDNVRILAIATGCAALAVLLLIAAAAKRRCSRREAQLS